MAESNKVKWKETLNLPRTDFPMKAQLNQREPIILQKWQEIGIYEEILKARADRPLYILHDGPPYANGKIHLGHALNKILKDFIVKSKSMAGYRAPYIPGWDCHGLPIEIKVDQELGERKETMPTLDIRAKCRTYAEKYLDIQRRDFIRLGVFGGWDTPYTTLDHSYEATVIRYLRSFVNNGNVYRKKRPVHWCTSCETALAEAEVEYADHTSTSIYVKFRLIDIPDILKTYQDEEIDVLIWTTTPWTIPANLAIALHPDFEYALFRMNGTLAIAATRLIPLIAELIRAETEILVKFEGAALNGLRTRHPLYDRDSLIINTDYVVLDQGTGCVHTAPGHGEEDFRAGLEYNLDIYSPVGPAGHFDATTGKYEGQEVFAANPGIVADLEARGRLLHRNTIQHSYPHCWRCKNPVIFRATEQWFIAMDRADLRTRALDEIKKARWLPPWGEERISSMIGNRPDWCISRQRDWGVPIPAFYCQTCRKPLLTTRVLDHVERVFAEHGSDAWWQREVSDLMPPGTTCGECAGSSFEKGMDIVDVWFESGSSFGILDEFPGHRFPADMYIEGPDQYRGWFHSSLLVGVSARGESPYRHVISHGFTLDAEGHAMSKSMGNAIEPQSIIQEKGAEILRLWVSMVNYREDVRLGEELLSRLTESYRNIRNRWRFMLGVLADFDPNRDSVDDRALGEADLFILTRLQEVKKRVLEAYENYEYHIITHTVTNFFTNELSAFYLNVMKDNLYCNAASSEVRRASQTAIFKVLRDTLLLMAPILSFTSEEAWEFLPRFEGKRESVHLHLFPEIEPNHADRIDTDKWERLTTLRERILKEIEDARSAKVIGDSLEAEIGLALRDESLRALVRDHPDLLKEILVVSGVELLPAGDQEITIRKSQGAKCPRCWNWFQTDIPADENGLCPRCRRVMGSQNG